MKINGLDYTLEELELWEKVENGDKEASKKLLLKKGLLNKIVTTWKKATERKSK
jgi:hypothetical protein